MCLLHSLGRHLLVSITALAFSLITCLYVSGLFLPSVGLVIELIVSENLVLKVELAAVTFSIIFSHHSNKICRS